MAENFGPRRTERRERVLEVGDQVALEAAQQTLLVPACRRRVLRPLGLADPRVGRGFMAELPDAVEVGRAGDEGVTYQDEQHESRRRGRRRKMPVSCAKSERQGFSALSRSCGTNYNTTQTSGDSGDPAPAAHQ